MQAAETDAGYEGKKKKEILAGLQGLKETMGCLAIRWKRARMKTVLKTGSRIHDYGSSYSLGIIPLELNEMPTFWSLCSSPQGSKSRERKSNWTNADYSQKWWQYFSLPSTHTVSKLTVVPSIKTWSLFTLGSSGLSCVTCFGQWDISKCDTNRLY